jgi:flavin reductase (DIM6/NTAB) family NADH-FMN oxidoreductase RutF
VLRTFATGVTIVTSAGDEPPSGVTANAFTSVSLAPPLVLVCLNAASSTCRAIAGNRVFAVNVLSAEQEWLSRRFASPSRPRGWAAFSDVPHREGSSGAPILDGVACWLDCRLAGMHVAGDHIVVIGEVLAFDGDPGREPLVFHAGRYRVVRDADADAGRGARDAASISRPTSP